MKQIIIAITALMTLLLCGGQKSKEVTLYPRLYIFLFKKDFTLHSADNSADETGTIEGRARHYGEASKTLWRDG